MSWKESWSQSDETSYNSFLADLPSNEFLSWEISLHSELVRILHEVSNPFPIGQWINSRLGNKLEVSSGPTGIIIQGDANYVTEVAAVADATFEVSQPQDFLANLPPDTFIAEEVALRDAIYDCLASCGHGEMLLADIALDQNIQQRRLDLSQALGATASTQIGLDTWVRHRIGKEIIFRGRPKKKLVLTPEGEKNLRARQEVISTHMETAKVAEESDTRDHFFDKLPANEFTAAELALREAVTPEGEKNLRARQEVISTHMETTKVAEESDTRDHFFDKLPANEFTAAELALREAVYQYLLSLDHDGDVPLPDVSGDAVVKERRAELAEENDWTKQVGLYDWIKKRLVAEMQISRSQRPWTLHLTEAGRKEKFLASLPKESFTDDEVALRSILIETVDNWGSGMPTLSSIKRRPDVLACIESVLPVGCPMSLEEWIKSRIASEIRVRMGALETCHTSLVTRMKRQRTDGGISQNPSEP